MITSLNLKLPPALALHAKVAKFGYTHSLQHFAGVSNGDPVFQLFLPVVEAEKVKS
jgi:hypothetical protein